MRYFHGTSYKAYESIIQHGFGNPTSKPIWTCSDTDNLYVVKETYDNENLEYKTIQDLPAFRLAVNAGQIAAAHTNSKSNDIYVFEFDIPDTIELDPDSSCHNMFDSYEINTHELNDLIRNDKIEFHVYRCTNAYEPYVQAFYLTHLDSKLYKPKDKRLKYVLDNLRRQDTTWFYDEYIGVWDDTITIL